MAGPEKYEIPVMNPPETYYWGPLIDRQTAKALGRTTYFTGEPCVKGHIAERWIEGGCKECQRQRRKTSDYRAVSWPVRREYWNSNADHINAVRRARRQANG